MSKTQFRICDRVISRDELTLGMKGVVEFIDTDGDIFVNLGKAWAGHNGLNNVNATHMNGWWFEGEELELDKESKVLEILRTWHKSRE